MSRTTVPRLAVLALVGFVLVLWLFSTIIYVVDERQVREAAFDRIIAMMQASASFYTNEGEREKQEILNSTNAKAIEQAGEFYTFVRTREAYKKTLGNDTRLILTTDSEFFRLLKEIGKPEPVSPRPESPPVERR